MERGFYRFKTAFGDRIAGDLTFVDSIKDEKATYFWHDSLIGFSGYCPREILEPLKLTEGMLLRLVYGEGGYQDKVDKLFRYEKSYGEKEKFDRLVFTRSEEPSEFVLFGAFISRFHLVESQVANKVCTCNIFDLMARGCRCGGI